MWSLLAQLSKCVYNKLVCQLQRTYFFTDMHNVKKVQRRHNRILIEVDDLIDAFNELTDWCVRKAVWSTYSRYIWDYLDSRYVCDENTCHMFYFHSSPIFVLFSSSLLQVVNFSHRLSFVKSFEEYNCHEDTTNANRMTSRLDKMIMDSFQRRFANTEITEYSKV